MAPVLAGVAIQRPHPGRRPAKAAARHKLQRCGGLCPRAAWPTGSSSTSSACARPPSDNRRGFWSFVDAWDCQDTHQRVRERRQQGKYGGLGLPAGAPPPLLRALRGQERVAGGDEA